MSTAPELRDTPRPVTAWELETALLLALRQLDDMPDDAPVTPALADLLSELVNGTVEKRDALAGAFKRRLADVEALEARAADAKQKAERAARSLDSFKSYLLSLIELRNGEPLAGVQYTIKRQQNPPHVEISEAMPRDNSYWRNIPERWEPDKASIKRDLSLGVNITGARLVPGDWRVVIR